MNYQPPQAQYSAPSTQQPAAICALKSPADAIHILEAVRLGLVPRVTRRLTGHERTMIRPGTVWVWEEEETNMKRWTDGRRWGASRVGGGGFLVYTESSENLSPPPNRSDSPLYPHGYGAGSRRSESLIKQTYSTNMTHPVTGKNKRFHVVAYSSKHNPQGDGHSPLPLPRDLPLLANIRITPGIWPEWEHRVASESSGATRKTDSPMAGVNMSGGSVDGRPVSNPMYPYSRRSPPRQDGHADRGRSPPNLNAGGQNWAQRDGKSMYPPGPQYAGYDHYQAYPPRQRVPSYPGPPMPYTPPGSAPGQPGMYDASRDRGAYNGMPMSAPPTGMPQYNAAPYGQYPTMSREDEERYRRGPGPVGPAPGSAGAVAGAGAPQAQGAPMVDGREKSPKMSIGSNILNTNNGDSGLTLPPLRMGEDRGKLAGSPADAQRKVGV